MLLGFLWSFWYTQNLDFRRLFAPLDPMPPMFADSGAYTAHTKGQPVNVMDYGSWVYEWRKYFPHYANLDVKGDVDAGLRNLEVLQGLGLAPIPVYHGGEPWSVWEDFCRDFDYVALGGMAGGVMQTHNPKVLHWLDKCFEIANGKAVHGFGMTNWSVVRRYPWRSVDSSSIGSGYRYGQVNIYNPYEKSWKKWAVADKIAWGRYGWLVREYGLEPADFSRPRTRGCTRALIRLATRSMRKAIDDLPQHESFKTQMYVVDDGGTQAGLRRVEAFNQANQTQVYVADTAMQERDVGDGLTRADVVNEVNAA